MRYILSALALVVVGCAAQTTYYHPNKTAADFERDKYDCYQDGVRHAADLGFRGNPLIANDHAHTCMLMKYGYTTTPPAQPAPTVERPPEPPDGHGPL